MKESIVEMELKGKVLNRRYHYANSNCIHHKELSNFSQALSAGICHATFVKDTLNSARA